MLSISEAWLSLKPDSQCMYSHALAAFEVRSEVYAHFGLVLEDFTIGFCMEFFHKVIDNVSFCRYSSPLLRESNPSLIFIYCRVQNKKTGRCLRQGHGIHEKRGTIIQNVIRNSRMAGRLIFKRMSKPAQKRKKHSLFVSCQRDTGTRHTHQNAPYPLL